MFKLKVFHSNSILFQSTFFKETYQCLLLTQFKQVQKKKHGSFAETKYFRII